MRQLFLGIAAVATSAVSPTGVAAVAYSADPGPSANRAAAQANYVRLAEALWETVNKNFFDPAMNGVDFVAVRQRYLPLFATVRTDAEFLDLGNRMIRELKTSHLDVIPPAGFWERGGTAAQGSASQRLRTSGGRVFHFASGSGVSAEGFRPGDEILSPPADLTGPVGGAGTIRVRGCDGEERSVPVIYRKGVWPPYHERQEIAGPGGRRVLYARIGRFNDDTIDFSDELIAAARNADGIILDVRNNSGGSITALYLANYFMSGSQPTVTMMGREVLARLGRRPTPRDISEAPRVSGKYRARDVLAVLRRSGSATFMSEGRGTQGYTGPVSVLVNGRTGSAAEGFAWIMQGGTDAQIIGRPTAGALIRGQEFELPFGWSVTVPVYGLWGPQGQSYIDQPVIPDISTEWTKEDFCSDQDPDLTAAMRVMFPAEPVQGKLAQPR